MAESNQIAEFSLNDKNELVFKDLLNNETLALFHNYSLINSKLLTEISNFKGDGDTSKNYYCSMSNISFLDTTNNKTNWYLYCHFYNKFNSSSNSYTPVYNENISKSFTDGDKPISGLTSNVLAMPKLLNDSSDTNYLKTSIFSLNTNIRVSYGKITVRLNNVVGEKDKGKYMVIVDNGSTETKYYFNQAPIYVIVCRSGALGKYGYSSDSFGDRWIKGGDGGRGSDTVIFAVAPRTSSTSEYKFSIYGDPKNDYDSVSFTETITIKRRTAGSSSDTTLFQSTSVNFLNDLYNNYYCKDNWPKGELSIIDGFYGGDGGTGGATVGTQRY